MKLAGWMIAAALAGSLGCLPMQKAPDTKPAPPADAPKPMPTGPAKPADSANPAAPSSLGAKTTDEITESNAAETANKLEADMQSELKAIDKKSR